MIRNIALVAPALLAGAVLAQIPEPAAELSKLEPLVGNWESKGTMTQPGMPPMAWTAKSITAWDLDGHALREDMAISFAGMPPLVMRNYTIWDAEYEVHRAFSVNNMGEITEGTLEWLDDHTIVQFSTGVQEGMPFGERWVTRFADGKMEFASSRMSGSDETVEIIQGSGHKIDATPDIDILGAGAFQAFPVSGAMKQLTKMAGHYELDAESVPSPGADAMAVKGTTEVHVLFDGLVVHVKDHGTNIPYKSEHWMAWSEQDGAFRHIAVNNMGHGEMSPCEWVGRDLVATSNSRMQGKPAAAATVLHTNDAGKLTGIVSHVTWGAEAPFVSFRGTWTLAEH